MVPVHLEGSSPKMEESTRKAPATERHCASCGSVGAKKRCGRCLALHYCNSACQKNHWKSHKAHCCDPAVRIPGTEGINLPRKLELATDFYRLVKIQSPRPEHVSCVCFCCAIMLKRCKTPANDEQDVNGMFIVPAPCEEPFPAELLLGEVGSTGYHLGSVSLVDGRRGMAACLACAHALRENSPMAHIELCRRRLQTPALPAEFSDLSIVEKRLVAMVQLIADPDFSKGPASIAGVITDSKVKVPFCFADIEALAFPHLHSTGGDFAWDDKNGSDDLLHYTLMRLYSVDSRWRSDYDYVMFSLHRLVAYGVWKESKLAQLPAALHLSRFEELESVSISIRNYAPN